MKVDSQRGDEPAAARNRVRRTKTRRRAQRVFCPDKSSDGMRINACMTLHAEPYRISNGSINPELGEALLAQCARGQFPFSVNRDIDFPVSPAVPRTMRPDERW